MKYKPKLFSISYSTPPQIIACAADPHLPRFHQTVTTKLVEVAHYWDGSEEISYEEWLRRVNAEMAKSEPAMSASLPTGPWYGII